MLRISKSRPSPLSSEIKWGAHMNMSYSIHSKWGFLCSSNRSYRPPRLCRLLNLDGYCILSKRFKFFIKNWKTTTNKARVFLVPSLGGTPNHTNLEGMDACMKKIWCDTNVMASFPLPNLNGPNLKKKTLLLVWGIGFEVCVQLWAWK